MLKFPRRFALSTLLFAMLVVAAVFGYAQWRKQTLIAEVERLDGLTTVIEVSDDWFWPSVTPKTMVVLNRNEDGRLSHGGKVLTVAEAKEHCQSVERRLRAIGVKEVGYGVIVVKKIPDGDLVELESHSTSDGLLRHAK